MAHTILIVLVFASETGHEFHLMLLIALQYIE